MTARDQKRAAEAFVTYWTAQRGSEKGEDQTFWNSLLGEVLGVSDVKSRIKYQEPVCFNDGSTKFLDAWIPETQVLIEHKSRGIDLDAPQAGHRGQTPFEQAWDYDNNRPRRERARWIVVANFDEIRIHDMEADRPAITYQTILLKDLAKEVNRLSFLVTEVESIRDKEARVSVEAGRVVGKLYSALLDDLIASGILPSPQTSHTSHTSQTSQTLSNLNVLCVRLVFCVYAEDAGVFGKDQFLNFLRQFKPASFHLQLRELFKVLSQREHERSAMLPDELKAFPFVGGGLFRDEVEIPVFSDKVADILLNEASEHFDWSEISPTIFGAVFESTLNPETRRKGGMHYTSEENIHKVIDPLFLDALKSDLAAVKVKPTGKARDRELEAFQEKLGALRFLDPACGSGNFLTETYLSLRKLENEALEMRFRGQGQFDLEDRKLIHVSINQFYGIEINDFAVTVAQTAMWIAECKMMEETNRILSKNFTPLPLTDSAKIVEGNALRMDWEGLLEKVGGESRWTADDKIPISTSTSSLLSSSFDYIMGNPPFIGASMMSAEQKAEAVEIFGKGKRVNSIDYVGAWYYKAAALMVGGGPRTPRTRCAFVSTNSITQGEQVAPLWRKLYEEYGLEIDFAWRTFVWDSEATEKAHVHVVIIGFSVGASVPLARNRNATNDATNEASNTDCGHAGRVTLSKRLFNADGTVVEAKNINPYLVDAPTAFVESRGTPLCAVPSMTYGNKPSDGGNLILSQEERDALLGSASDPQFANCGLRSCIRRFVGARDFINNDEVRYCLWLKGVSPSVYRNNAEVMRRLDAVRAFRLKSSAAPTRATAETPYLFFSSPHSESPYLLLPEVSSERRQIVPIGFMPPEVIAANTTLVVPNATVYHFGVLTSSVHMAWMRAVAGRLEMRYRYSAAIVYNNFPWPECLRPLTQSAQSSQGGAETLRSFADSAFSASAPAGSNPVNPGTPIENGADGVRALPSRNVSGASDESELKSRIEKTAQSILDARALYPDSSLADLYDPLTMPPELRKAHAANDAAVMKAYGFPPDLTEPEIVSKLFEMYAKLTR